MGTVMEDINLVLPQAALTDYDANDQLANYLRGLTRILVEKSIGDPGLGFGLGGQYGYGVDYNNETFRMHPYCWCDKENCPWCSGCTCPNSAYHYFVDGEEVEYKQFGDFYDLEAFTKPTGGRANTLRELWKLPDWNQGKLKEELDKASAEANKRRATRHDPVCNYCLIAHTGTGKIPAHGAPNFWHKKSGLRVWWYKWIGRDMESKGSLGDLDGIFRECGDSILYGRI